MKSSRMAKRRKAPSSQRRITTYFAVRRTLTRAETTQLNALLSRAATSRILGRHTKWMDMTSEEQTDTVQATKCFGRHFC